MNIKIYIAGEKLEQFYKEAIAEYEKRLSKYCKIRMQYFKKADQIYSKVAEQDYKIRLNTMGNTISSEELANKIDTLGITGVSSICIIICDKNMEFNTDEIVAISPMNMSLGLKTTILYEQIYRAYRIINNQAYHK